MATLEETLQNEDFMLSTKVEAILYLLAKKVGVNKDLILEGLYDEYIGQAKEAIYKSFSRRLDFEYDWDGYYKINQTKTPKDQTGVEGATN